jgi:type IV secretion system protein TrbL
MREHEMEGTPAPAVLVGAAPRARARDRVRPALRAGALWLLAVPPRWLRPRVPTDMWEPTADARRVAREAGWRAVTPLLVWRGALTAVLLLGVVWFVASVPDAHAQAGVLDSVQNQYQAMSRMWIAPMARIGRRLFIALATIEFVLSAILWLGRSEDLTDIARRFLLKFILTSFLLMLLTGATYWLPPIVNTFPLAAQTASAMPVPDGPSGILDMGIRFAFDDIGNANIPWSFEALGAVLFKLITQVVVLLSFTAVAAQMLLVWVETYIALGGGVLFLGFAGFRATAGFAENYLNYLIYNGVRLFVFYLLVALGTAIVFQARVIFRSNVTFDARVMAEVLALSVTFAAITTRVPGNAAARIAGGAQLGIGHALRHL